MKTRSLFKILLIWACLVGAGLTLAQAPKDAPPRTHTSDGRAFEALTEADEDALTDADYSAYKKWGIRKKQAEIDHKRAQIELKKNEISLMLVSVIPGLLSQARVGTLNRKTLDPNVVEGIADLADGKIPSNGQRENAIELLRYLK